MFNQAAADFNSYLSDLMGGPVMPGAPEPIAANPKEPLTATSGASTIVVFFNAISGFAAMQAATKVGKTADAVQQACH